MKLYLARHAHSRELMTDHSEELSAEGIRQAHCVGRFLKDGGMFHPAEIWHSSSPCSFQTATIYKDEAVWDAELVNRDDLAKDSEIDFCYDEICRRDKSIVVVGHKKYLQLLCARIVGSNNAEMIEIVNGGIVCLNSAEYYCGVGHRLRHWSLVWLLNPDMFEINDTVRAS